ncbi:hypothetical protein M514_00796 [Trichuris suis]|uniref:Uncharacterized protein n=1 Tax=Trichuris suis TaxID=68888 RepID=A0A085N9A6_9BILA|nr:hypothetical protein M514_00796 [Trichuris suis]
MLDEIRPTTHRMMILLVALIILFASTPTSASHAKQLQEIQKRVKLSKSEMGTLSNAYQIFKERTSKCFETTCYYQVKPRVPRIDLPAEEYANVRATCRRCMGNCQELHKELLFSVGNLLAKMVHYNNLDNFDGMDRPELGLLYWKKHKDNPFKIAPLTLEQELKTMREQSCV